MQNLIKSTRKRHAMIAIAQWFDTSLTGRYIDEHIPTWVTWTRWLLMVIAYVLESAADGLDWASDHLGALRDVVRL